MSIFIMTLIHVDMDGEGVAQWFSLEISAQSQSFTFFAPHLNRDEIESNLSVPGIQGNQENALIKSFEMSPHLICL